MWVQTDVLGLFSGSVGSFLVIVGLGRVIFSVNVGTKVRCFRAEPFIFSGRYTYGQIIYLPERLKFGGSRVNAPFDNALVIFWP
jgi:hypothetical protein